MTVSDHLKLVEAFRPNVFECLCDSAPSAGCKLKRIRKSVDRSLKFLDETIAERENSEVQWHAISYMYIYMYIDVV